MPVQPLSIEPCDVPSYEAVINCQIFVKAGRDRWHHALPHHSHRAFSTFFVHGVAASASSLAGKTGGRTDSAPQPNRNSAAAPHIRPWHGPIPLRVCNFASRHELHARIRSKLTSSQRQTSVSSAARHSKLGPESKRGVECIGKSPVPFTFMKEAFRPRTSSCSSVPGNLAFRQ